MHTYATNCPHHLRLVMLIAFAAIGLSSGFAWAAAGVKDVFGFPIGGISSFAVFGGLYLLFDKALWRYRWIRQLMLVPDLNGEWKCDGLTLIKKGETVSWPWSAEITISQSWSGIVIVLRRADSSSSRSIAASLYSLPGEGYRLIYHYDNTPDVHQGELTKHSGLCDLIFENDVTKASGRYFTDRDRMTVGQMSLTRKARSK